MKYAIIPILLLAVLASISPAEEREVAGFEDGYVNYGDDYWYKADVAYIRTKAYEPQTYYWNGYSWYPNAKTYSFKYSKVPVKKEVVYKAPEFVPGWKEKALEIAKQRDEYESYLKTLDVLGFKGQAYAPYGHNHSYKQQYSSSYGLTGNTLYGYSVNTLREMYGSTDLNVLYQQSAKLVQGAQQLAGQGQVDFATLVREAGGNAARVAEILAKAKAAEVALNAANAAPSIKIQTNENGVGSAVMPPAIEDQQPLAGNPENARLFLRTIGIPLCGSCHSGKTLKGNFDIIAYPTMPIEQKEVVWSRIFTRDPDKVMPRLPNGGPGSLSPAQKQAFISN